MQSFKNNARQGLTKSIAAIVIVECLPRTSLLHKSFAFLSLKKGKVWKKIVSGCCVNKRKREADLLAQTYVFQVPTGDSMINTMNKNAFSTPFFSAAKVKEPRKTHTKKLINTSFGCRAVVDLWASTRLGSMPFHLHALSLLCKKVLFISSRLAHFSKDSSLIMGRVIKRMTAKNPTSIFLDQWKWKLPQK